MPAETEGIAAELSSAAGLTAPAREARGSGKRVVCVLTGHGLKDPHGTPCAIVQVEPDAKAIAAAAR